MVTPLRSKGQKKIVSLVERGAKKTQKKEAAKPGDQIEAFKQAARVLECDESEEAFNRALKKIGKSKPAVKSPKRRR